MHIQQAHLQALIWKADECTQPLVFDLTMYGWKHGTDGMPPTLTFGITQVALK